MKKTIALFCFIIVVFGYLSAYAATSVWVARSGGQTVYLGGTIHMLRAADFPLPAEFDTAYQQADSIVFETDLNRMMDPGTQHMMLSRMMYNDGRSLDKVLAPKTYTTLKRYCEKIGVPVTSLHPFKPAMAILTLLSLELRRIGIAQDGIDLHFYQKAVADGKSIAGLEPLEVHLTFLAAMGDGNADNFVTHAIKDFKRTRQLMDKLIAAWRDGKGEELDQLFLADMKRDYPVLHQKLLVERNQNWLPIIDAYFQTPETEFVLVGAAHLVGEQGLLQQLAKRGYTIRQLR